MRLRISSAIFLLCFLAVKGRAQEKPNIILIYTDDVGYGDLSCYGATKIATPNIDKLATEGLRFTRAYATSATCTPSRYSLLTGTYAWRKEGTGIAPGDAGLLIPTNRITLPAMLKEAGYATGVVGKWHLGLGMDAAQDWNGDVVPGPLEIGFDYSFILPATGDRVPCVYMENHRVVDLDPSDPIRVSYREKIGDEPTGKDNPGLLKFLPSHGHDQTIINGISRIGYMSGGKSARWVDEDMADVLISRATAFIEQKKNSPFFLYFSTHDIHVPRVPNAKFEGKSGMGPRGDVILQLDYTVGEIINIVERNGLSEKTMIVFTSDNGPVIDDGYEDEAVAKLSGHTPSGNLRGGKYSAFEAGTRIPLIVYYPGVVKPGASNALFSQVDFLATFSAMTGQAVPSDQATDSRNSQDVLFGKDKKGREYIVEHAANGTLSITNHQWKYIEPNNSRKIDPYTNIELGNDPQPQLYNIRKDEGERNNLATSNSRTVKEMKELLEKVKLMQ